ncbi:MAG TPA: pitrilysin family protein [Anaerolineales bacterium]|nr:pitrilysin family protein [Anaerolineales bacterium]
MTRMEPNSLSLSLPGPDDIHRRKMANDIVVLVRSNFNSPSVVVNGYIMAGSLFDQDERLGLASFTADALLRGTAQRSFHEIYDRLESAGANLHIAGGTHTTGFGSKALAEDLDLLLELLVEALRQPTFPAEQIELLRARHLTSLAIRAQDTGEMSTLTFDQIAYPEHPYSRPDDGYPDTIQAITREDLVNFHQVHYGPRGMVISVVGAIDPDQVFAKVEDLLGDWQNPNQPTPPKLPPNPTPAEPLTRKIDIPGKFQADLVVGVIGPERRSRDFLPTTLGNNILGVFGMMGRIGESVREKAGLAYYAYSKLSGGMGPGPWYVSAGVDPQKVEQALELIRDEIERFSSQPVTADELADSQSNFIGRLPLSLESNSGMASAILNLERYNLGMDYYRRYPDLVRQVKAEEVLESARRYWDLERLAVGIAGP